MPSAAPAQTAPAQTSSTTDPVPLRRPALSRLRTLAFEREGHIHLRFADGSTMPVTSGSAYHRDPSFAPGASGSPAALYYASDSAGNYDIWKVPLDDRDRPSGAPVRLTTMRAQDVSPSVSTTGQVVFQRGLGGDARIWVREADGRERRLTSQERIERRPRFSADGKRVALIALTETSRKVVVVQIDGGAESTLTTDASIEDIAWGRDNQLAVSLRTGVVVVPATGTTYQNLVSRNHGDIDWSVDGSTITIAEQRDVSVSYNGDPDRGVDRTAHERQSLVATGPLPGIFQVPAPRAVDADRATVAVDVVADRAALNTAAFDRVWERSDRLYFSDTLTGATAAARRSWRAVRDRLRPAAIAAATDSALQTVIHDALRQRPALRREATGKAAVSSAHPTATAAGLEMFRQGGNVIDAAVAVSFALGVVEPDASGIGGYGEMVIALTGQQPTLIEFMSRVPEDAGLDNKSLLVNGRYPSDGPVLVNVPGTVAGMHLAWQRYGSRKLTWAQLLAPAIRAARDGYIVSDGLATTLATEREHFAKYEGSRALFFRDGKPLVAGDTLRNPDLAWVLEQIAAGGADGFYKGDVAERWVKDLHAKGNAMKTSDLARYFANEREPVCGTYRQYRLCSGSPPVSGGADLVARLNLLEQYPAPKRYSDDAGTLHAALSAWFLTPSSRGKIADPALWPIDVASIVAKDSARVRWQCFDTERALTPQSTRGDTLACLKARSANTTVPAAAAPPSSESASFASASSPCGEDHATEMDVCHAAGTTAFTVADADGNVVAVTQTLGTWGGNFYVTPGLGFLSNDKLTSYGTDPTQYGSRLPFARHGSTLAPTIAFKGNRPVFAVSAAGNAWITSAVYQTLLGALDYNLGPQAALELPRFLPGGGGGPPGAGGGNRYTIQLEDGFAPQVVNRLRSLGYDLSFVSARGELREGYGAAIRIDGKSVTAGADPRRAGEAGAVK
ncbi:gamma-glutamyltransferase [Gemmatimonas aurantiaca]|uniref:gamma-glutamyltransferase n=1 Tax=Gemmatimonas aurantiaca TaxID=173480 RepID=UPI00301C093E